MADNNTLTYRCPNSECGHIFRVRRPLKDGVYTVTCPQCHKPFKAKMTAAAPAPEAAKQPQDEPKVAKQQQDEPKAAKQPQDELKVEEAPKGNAPLDHSGEEPRDLGLTLKVGEKADICCPFCHITVPYTAQKEGTLTLGCPKCKGRMTLLVKNPTKTLDGLQYPHRGKLQLARFAFLKKDFALHIGKNLIGRTDKDCPSEIQIDDSTVSRRCAELEVRVNEKGGFLFLFRVLHTTNPVLVNHIKIDEGSEMFLNYGDTITMGRTQLRFLEDK